MADLTFLVFRSQLSFFDFIDSLRFRLAKKNSNSTDCFITNKTLL